MKLKNLLLIILAIGALTCLGLYARQKLNLTYFGDVKRSETLIYDEVYDSNIDLISIDNKGYADITIKETDESNISLKIYADKNNINFNKNDNQINIKSKVKKCIIFCDEETSVIEINVPRNYENNIKIDSELGNVEIGEFDNANVDVNFDTGNFKLGAAKNLHYVGDATIIYLKRIKGRLELENDTGNINIDALYLTDNSYIKTDVSNINILHTNEIKIDIKNGSRLSHINNNYTDSNITLTLSNDIGEININN